MKKLLILAPYCSLPGEKKFNRFLYLAEMLSNNFDVTLVTSDFRHYDKRHRENTPSVSDFKIIKIHEPGYNENISLKRIFSHRVFLKNFINWFDNNSSGFEIIYSAYPLIGTNLYIAKNKHRYNYKYVVDIQDVWPESIASAIPIMKVIPYYLLPYSKKANFCYKHADAIIAVSKTYLDRALRVSTPSEAEVIYIGSDSKKIDSAPAVSFDDDIFRLVYIGSLGHSYDVKTVLLAVNDLVKQGLNVEFHIAGGGRQEKVLKKLASKNIIFHGFVDFEEMVSLIKGCNLGVNSLVESAPQSITNKLSDYFSIGIPILNSQKNPELIAILNGHKHINYIAGDVMGCELAIKDFISNKELHFFSPRVDFYRKNIYPKIRQLLERLL